MHDAATIDHALALLAQGSTQQEVASLVGCSRASLRSWARGELPRRRPGARPCPRCATAHPVAASAAYVHLLGLYLGDGCISVHPRGVHRLRVNLDVRYPGIIEECRTSLAAVAPGNRVGAYTRASGGYAGSSGGTCVELSAYAKWWPCVFPQHGPGRKHERVIVLAPWQEELVDEHPQALLRGLVQSDGCRFVNTGRNWRSPRYSFSNRSADIRAIFTAACDRLDLHWTLAPHTVYVSCKADVARMDSFIGPKC